MARAPARGWRPRSCSAGARPTPAARHRRWRTWWLSRRGLKKSLVVLRLGFFGVGMNLASYLPLDPVQASSQCELQNSGQVASSAKVETGSGAKLGRAHAAAGPGRGAVSRGAAGGAAAAVPPGGRQRQQPGRAVPHGAPLTALWLHNVHNPVVMGPVERLTVHSGQAPID